MLGSTGEVVVKAAALAAAAGNGVGLVVVLANADPTGGLVGPAGFASAGLLGGVLAWLCFFHLPAKDRMTRELIVGFQEQINTLSANFQAQINALAAQSLTARTADRDEMVGAMKEHTAMLLSRIEDRHLRDREQAAAFGDRTRKKEANRESPDR